MYTSKLKALHNLSIDKKEDTIQSLLAELEIYRSMLGDGTGMEGLAGGMPKIIVGIIDVFLRIGNTFKTNIAKFHKKLKRSEIRYFTESNRMKVSKVEDTPYARFVKLQVDKPTGMSCTFKDAITNIEEIYKLADAHGTILPFMKTLESVESMLDSNNNTINNTLSGLVRQADMKSKLLATAIKENRKLLDDKRSKTMYEFNQAYANMPEFVLVRSKLTDMEEQLSDTIKISDTLTSSDSQLTSLITYLEDNDNKLITRQLVDNILKVVTIVGNNIDTHGRTAMQQMALEHNHILNINSMYKKI